MVNPMSCRSRERSIVTMVFWSEPSMNCRARLLTWAFIATPTSQGNPADALSASRSGGESLTPGAFKDSGSGW
jgi:hypothetical protein